MIEAAGGMVISQATEPGPPGLGIHEMGTARMGNDPKTSVLNKFNQAHEVPNLFCTDGAAMSSSGLPEPVADLYGAVCPCGGQCGEMLKEGAI